MHIMAIFETGPQEPSATPFSQQQETTMLKCALAHQNWTRENASVNIKAIVEATKGSSPY